MKKFILFFFILLSLNTLVFALSEQASNASAALSVAELDVKEVFDKGLSISRINESYTEAFQLYIAQVNLEEVNKKSDYDLVFEYTSKVRMIKEAELEANDELLVFLEEYSSMNNSIDLSQMQELYNNIISSFKNERYEDTLVLVSEGYIQLTQIQSSQTALNIFYDSTSSNLKRFFYNNWKSFVVALLIIFFFWLLFHNSIKKIKIKREIKSLEKRRDVIKSLMQNLQRNYFESKKISEEEYSVKMKSFSDMLLNITRQILLLKEELNKMIFFEKKELLFRKKSKKIKLN